jgi:hypothetical protein
VFKLPQEALWSQWAPLPLRFIIEYGFMAHGWAKLSRGPAEFAKLLEQIGAPLPEAMAWVSTLIEVLGGLSILAGAFVAAVLSQPFERFIDRNQVVRGGIVHDFHAVQRHARPLAAAFETLLIAGTVKKNAAHGLGGGRKEVSPAVPVLGLLHVN